MAAAARPGDGPRVASVQLGHRHTGIVVRAGDRLPPGGAALLTRQDLESTHAYAARIVAAVQRLSRMSPMDDTTVVVAGLPLGAAGPRVRGDLARLRELHAAVHDAFPDAVAVAPGGPAAGGYPAALEASRPPQWLRQANQHPRGSREPLRAAWDAAGRHLAALPSPTPPPSTQVDRSGRIPAPGVPAGQPVGGGAPAGAGAAPRAGHPTFVQPIQPTAVIRPYGHPELRRQVQALNAVMDAHGREFAAARRPLLDAFNNIAAAAAAAAAARAERQRLRRLRLEDHHDPRPPARVEIDACAIEDLARGRGWLRSRVRVGVATTRLYELQGERWKRVSLEELRKLPTLHAGRQLVYVRRGRWEPSRLTLALAVLVVAALAAAAM